LDPWIFEKQEIVAENGVVSSAHQLASQAGVEMLMNGGNAVDAAAATSFALGVVEPFMSGIGGGGVINIRLKSGERCVIDGFVQAPKKIDCFDWSLVGHKVAAVPGIVDGFSLALEKFGTMGLEEVTKPAVRYAENGFSVNSYIASFASSQISRMNGAGVKLFSKDGFKSLEEGDLLVNKDLARTLEMIGKMGSDAFYRGEIAQMIVQDMDANGGLISQGDLAGYQARVYAPLVTSYRDFELQGAPYAHGGVTVAHMLNILERFSGKKLEADTPQYHHILAETQKRVFTDRFNHYGDHRFVRVPWKGIISKEYAGELSSQIDPEKSSGIVDAGDPCKYDDIGERPSNALKSSQFCPISKTDLECTTSFSVIDKDRHMVATTQSIGSAFGSGVCVPGGGFFLNNFVYMTGVAGFTPIIRHPNYPEPGKRPVNNHSPTLAFRDGKPFMAFGSPGGRRQQGACVQAFVHVVDHGMGIQKAISAPRLHCEGNTLWMEKRIPERIREDLRQRGHKVIDMPGYTMFFGGLNGVLVNPETGKLHGGADPRRPCSAVGY